MAKLLVLVGITALLLWLAYFVAKQKKKKKAQAMGRAIRALPKDEEAKPFTPLGDFLAGKPEPPLPTPRQLPHVIKRKGRS